MCIKKDKSLKKKKVLKKTKGGPELGLTEAYFSKQCESLGGPKEQEGKEISRDSTALGLVWATLQMARSPSLWQAKGTLMSFPQLWSSTHMLLRPQHKRAECVQRGRQTEAPTHIQTARAPETAGRCWAQSVDQWAGLSMNQSMDQWAGMSMNHAYNLDYLNCHNS